MHKARLVAAFYSVCAVMLLVAAVILYVQGLSLRTVSFGLGMSYVLPAVTCFGLFIVSGACAFMEVAALRRV